jgi:hypothetical protein
VIFFFGCLFSLGVSPESIDIRDHLREKKNTNKGDHQQRENIVDNRAGPQQKKKIPKALTINKPIDFIAQNNNNHTECRSEIMLSL